MFGFVKKCFFIAMTFFSCNALECVSMNNKECEIKPEIKILTVMNLHFILQVLKQVNAVAVVIILMIHIQKCVLLMLLKT